MKKKLTLIGIDLGGTKLVLEGFDDRMNRAIRIKEKTQSKNQKTILNQVYRLIDGVITSKTKAIGIVVPGPVNALKGTIAKTPHLPFKRNLSLKILLEKRYKVPVLMENDINGFLMAESKRPKLQKIKHLIGVMIGTGVGGAIMANGEMLYGSNGYAGEVGHMIIDQSSALKSFEQKSGGSFIPKLAESLGIKKKMTPYDLEKNTPESRKIKKALVQNMGVGLANLNLIFNPEAFVLGGSIYHLFLSDHKPELKKIITQHSLDGKSPQLIDGSKNTSAAKGAAMMAKQSVLE